MIILLGKLLTLTTFLTEPCSGRWGVHDTLDAMIRAEFGDRAEKRVKEFQAQLADIDRQIINVVNAIKAGSFSKAL